MYTHVGRGGTPQEGAQSFGRGLGETPPPAIVFDIFKLDLSNVLHLSI